MARVINLDALMPEQCFVTLDGANHEIKPATVDTYLRVMKAREKLKNASDEVEGLEQAIMMITLSCPTLERSRLMALPLPALTAITDVIQEMMEGESGKEANAKEAEKAGE